MLSACATPVSICAGICPGWRSVRLGQWHGHIRRSAPKLTSGCGGTVTGSISERYTQKLYAVSSIVLSEGGQDEPGGDGHAAQQR